MQDLVIVRPRIRSFFKRTVPFAAIAVASFVFANWNKRVVGWPTAALIAGGAFIALTFWVGSILFLAGRKRWVTVSSDGLQAPDQHGIQRACTWDAVLDAEAIPAERGGYAVQLKIRHLGVMLRIDSEVVDQPSLLPAVMRHVPREHPLATALREAGA